MSSWVLSGGRSGQVDRASTNGGGTHHCTYNSRKRGAEPLLVMSARNQEKPNSSPGLALLETASPLRLMGPKWSTLGCPLHAFIGKAALPDIGLQCSQPHHGREHGQRRTNAVLAVAGHDRARPTLQNPTFTGACPQDDACIRPH